MARAWAWLPLAAGLAWWGCGGEAQAPEVQPEREVAAPVYLVGIDGASWRVLAPAMDAGRMPNLSRMLQQGAHGILHSMEPTASAILWTTIVTGRTPDAHGIRGFVVERPEGRRVPVTSNLRRVRALWNIASEAGITVGFLGWWVSWPAEPVRGFIASDYTWPLKKDAEGFATGTDPDLERPARTYPPELMQELEPFNLVESRMTAEELRALGLDAIPNMEGYAVRDMMLKDISFGRMVPFLLERVRPSLFAVYFDGLDAFCHIFWPAYRDYMRARREGASELERLDPRVRALGGALDRHLERLDAVLGELMARAGSRGVVIVISDHGYGDNPGRRPVLRGYDEWIRPPHWHTLDGVVALAGAPVRAGVRLEGAGILDVAPTVLALLGLPVSEEMPGRVWEEALVPEFLEGHPVRRIPTYETGAAPASPEGAVPSPYDEAVLERLRALGYID